MLAATDVRWVFATRLGRDGRTAVETKVEPDGPTILGTARTAPYLDVWDPGFWSRLFGVPVRVRFAPPFDRAGNETRIVSTYAARLEPDAPVGSVGSVRGVVQCAARRAAGEPVVRDAWMRDEPPLRVTRAARFAIDTGTGPPVSIALTRTPFLLAPSRPLPLEDVLAGLDRRVAAQLRRWRDVPWSDLAETATLEENDTVEAVGVVLSPAERPTSGPNDSYRAGPSAAGLALGDTQGTRVCLRRLPVV